MMNRQYPTRNGCKAQRKQADIDSKLLHAYSAQVEQGE